MESGTLCRKRWTLLRTHCNAQKSPRKQSDHGRWLTLFGMDRTRARQDPRVVGAALWFSLLLVPFALLGHPGSARADSSGTQYENAIPTATGKSSSPHGQGAAVTPAAGGRLRTPTGAAARRRSHIQARARRRHRRNQFAATNRPQTPKNTLQQGSESSPLVPALIAIGAVGAMAVGVVLFKRRRERARGPATATARLPRSN